MRPFFICQFYKLGVVHNPLKPYCQINIIWLVCILPLQFSGMGCNI